MRLFHAALAGLTLVSCKSEATKDREVFDCSLTGQTATCLVMRYGWDEQDAHIAALKHRVETSP